MTAKVLVVSGASQPGNRLPKVIELAEHHVRAAGGDVRVLDLSTVQLPLMEFESAAQVALPEVERVREDAHWADGFILTTPEYHGNMSGALKNWFDFLYLELAGKFAGVMAVTGGGSGDMSIMAVKNCFAWCHGFTLPFHVAIRRSDFADGEIVAEKVIDRIARVAHDVVRYSPIIRRAFDQARACGPGVGSGVAGMHVDD